MLIAIGMRYRILDSKINSMERHYLLFIRYLAQNYALVGNLQESIISVMRGDLGNARELVKRMVRRLKFGVDDERVLNLAGKESRSVLISIINMILYKTVSAGGNMMIVGEVLNKVGDTILNIRARKEQNGRAFETSIYTLQVSTAAVSAAIIAVVGILSLIFSSQNVSTVFQFSPVNIGLVERLLLIMLVFLSIANGIAISIAYGKSIYVSLYFIGILMAMSAISYHIVLVFTNHLFASFFSSSPINIQS